MFRSKLGRTELDLLKEYDNEPVNYAKRNKWDGEELNFLIEQMFASLFSWFEQWFYLII